MNRTAMILLKASAMLFAAFASAAATECDRLAAHPSDPHRKATGVERANIDFPAAEAACRAVVATDPLSARARYQLGRVLYYQDKVAESLTHLEVAAETGYPQAIFVMGLLHLDGKTKRDECKAARLWLRSAALDHPWSGYYLVDAALKGRFESCELGLSHADLERYLTLARENLTVSASAGRVEALGERLLSAQRKPD